MERRQFIAVLALSLVPTSAGAAESKGSRLAELQTQLRDHYGDDTHQVLRTVREAIHEARRENPDLRVDDKDDLELLTEVAFRKCVDRLRAAGLRSDQVTETGRLATKEREI